MADLTSWLPGLVGPVQLANSGTLVPMQRSKWNFTGALTITDDPTNDQIIFDVTGGGGSTPSGTGFVHVTSGTQDGAARAVNLASADITGTLPTGNQAAQSMGGDISGTTASASVVSLTGSTGSVSVLCSNVVFSKSVSSATFGQSNQTTDVAATDLTVSASSAWSSASSNKNGANLILASGAAASGGTTGSVKINAGATTAMQIGLASTDFIQLGASSHYASAGFLRFGNAASPLIACRNSGNTDDLVALDTTSTKLYVGGNVSNTQSFSDVRLTAASGGLCGFGIAGFLYVFANANLTYFNEPIASNAGGGLYCSRSSVVFPSDADYTPNQFAWQSPVLDVTSSGSLTGTRKLILQTAAGSIYFVNNATSGGQSVNFIAASGTGVTVANGKRCIIYWDGTNMQRLTPDT